MVPTLLVWTSPGAPSRSPTPARSPEAGFERSALSVDVENDHGALSVYERCGFQVAESTYSYVLPLN
ncbi:N-acetyltransferase [Amycolatopsis panacis]|uniref:GNAT family N-acetyltransferase n=1 Tax=Amycolatopsis panacis TaxID=2340917 RepID=A0A419HZX6_9PSEU|nr:hypothetical protein [Amycolatopsis panacis]RJQ82742.1 hypothetical protein D5S19_21195 [Amycolatopsis panacis]